MLRQSKSVTIRDRIPSLLQLFQLRPHGSRLLTSGANYWFIAARLSVLLMALVEGLAWGYLGYLFLEGALRWVTAACAGLIMFLVVWMIDASLLTIDRSYSKHARTILGEAAERHQVKTATAVAVRVFVVVASLTITAPYLSQVIFHREIRAVLDADAARLLEEKRGQLRDSWKVKLASLDDELNRKRRELEAEISGTGRSGRYGRGPAAEAIAENVAAIELARTSTERAQLDESHAFERLASDWQLNREELASTFNVTLPEESILANRRALQDLTARPEYQQTEVAIKAFLLFIFLGMVLLKLFEPSSVKLYLSEVLQQEYSRYLGGSFDHVLPEGERSHSGAKAMTPQRLYQFLVGIWRPLQLREEDEVDFRVRRAAAERDLEHLEAILKDIEAAVAQARDQVEAGRARRETATQRYQGLLGAMDLVAGHVAHFRSEDAGLEDESRHLDARGKAEYGSHVRAQLSKAEKRLRELETAKDLEATKLKEVQAELADAQTELDVKLQELRELRDRILQERRKFLGSVFQT